jgi:hypothetical protein
MFRFVCVEVVERRGGAPHVLNPAQIHPRMGSCTTYVDATGGMVPCALLGLPKTELLTNEAELLHLLDTHTPPAAKVGIQSRPCKIRLTDYGHPSQASKGVA